MPDIVQGKTHENAGSRREGNGQQQPDKAEHIAKGEKREHQPDGMQTDAVAYQIGRQEIALDELPRSEDADDDQDLVKSGQNCTSPTPIATTPPTSEPT